MKFLLFSLIVICLANLANAESISIRAGEHSTFSRFVMRIPADTNWVLSQEADQARLALELDEVFFDTSEAFDRIPRERVLSMRQDSSDELVLNLGCDCGVRGFLFDGNLLVIDVSDEPPEAEVVSQETGVGRALPRVSVASPFFPLTLGDLRPFSSVGGNVDLTDSLTDKMERGDQGSQTGAVEREKAKWTQEFEEN